MGSPTVSTRPTARRSGRCPSGSRRRSRPQPIAGESGGARLRRPVRRAGHASTPGPAALIWRQALGEPVSDPPLVLGNQVIQATPGGQAAPDRPGVGRAPGDRQPGPAPGADAGRATRRGSSSTSWPTRIASSSSAATRSSCVAVEYLGHAAGSVAAPPGAAGPVPGRRREPDAQRRPLARLRDRRGRDRSCVRCSRSRSPAGPGARPRRRARSLWATGDRASAHGLCDRDLRREGPFRPLARTRPRRRSLGPGVRARARSERELWVASGRSARLVLDAENGKLAAAWTLAEAGPALAPPQLAGAAARPDPAGHRGPGRRTLGSRAGLGLGPLADRPRARPGGSPRHRGARGDALVTLGEDGRALALSRDRLTAGGFVEVPLPKPGGTRLPPGPLVRLESAASDLTVLVPAGPADHLLRPCGRADDFRRLELPAPLGAAPVFWGSDLLRAGRDGRRRPARSRGPASRAPSRYIEPFDRAHPIRWHAPVAARRRRRGAGRRVGPGPPAHPVARVRGPGSRSRPRSTSATS